MADDFETMRRAMVASQLRTNAVDDARLVAAMARVPRESFVPAEWRAVAYADLAIDLGGGRALNAPLVTGRLLNQAEIGPADRVLVIGGGYAAAVAAELAAEVILVESDPVLAATARAQGLTVIEGSLEAGAPDGAPYDVIVIDGAVEELPSVVIDQLAPSGRLTSGIVDRGVTRLAIGRRGGAGFGLVDFADAGVAFLPGFERPRAFVF